MPTQPVNSWRSALQVKRFRTKLIITVTLLAIYASLAPFLFNFIQHREGYFLNDYLLNRLPTYDVSGAIFFTLYLLVIFGIYSLIRDPNLFLTALQAYLLLTVFRSATMLLLPLEPPPGIAELHDPLVQSLFYQQSVTKDLFFSGHTSLVMLLGLFMTKLQWRIVFFIGTGLVAALLLIQHAHYTIDILIAPLFSWLAYRITPKKS